MRPRFGCGIHDLVFEEISATTLSAVEASVREALTTYEAADRAARRRCRSAAGADGLLIITIRYRVRRTNQIDNLVYPFFYKEGGRDDRARRRQARAAARRGDGPPCNRGAERRRQRGPAGQDRARDHRRRGADRRRGHAPARPGSREAGGQLLCRDGHRPRSGPAGPRAGCVQARGPGAGRGAGAGRDPPDRRDRRPARRLRSRTRHHPRPWLDRRDERRRPGDRSRSSCPRPASSTPRCRASRRSCVSSRAVPARVPPSCRSTPPKALDRGDTSSSAARPTGPNGPSSRSRTISSRSSRRSPRPFRRARRCAR